MSVQKKIKSYNVICWDFNRDNIEYYDVMPYLINTYREDSKRKTPVFLKNRETREGYKEFILAASRYQFWSRTQYEVILTGWPKQKNELKIDVFDQISMNIEAITDVFLDSIGL